ncbi:MAG: hypothetical protein KKA05_04235 [Alphaproteobacteria bacterium]|nr:hypothetical protein [Alphaproteobacteria bacterium]
MVTLYHASPYPIEGQSLNPATRNVALEHDASGTIIARAVPYDDAGAPYIYAADKEQFAMTYTVSKGVRFGNWPSANGRCEIMFVDQESRIGDPQLTGGIYSFESNDFIAMHNEDGPNGQWVSAQVLDLHAQAQYTPVRSFNDIMRTGVQIYQVADDPAYNANQFYEDVMHADGDAYEVLRSALAAGKIRWMNQERGINPVDDLTVAAAVTSSLKIQPPPPAF